LYFRTQNNQEKKFYFMMRLVLEKNFLTALAEHCSFWDGGGVGVFFYSSDVDPGVCIVTLGLSLLAL
jgi:hypothetical protein